jgi:hypothetical protein
MCVPSRCPATGLHMTVFTKLYETSPISDFMKTHSTILELLRRREFRAFLKLSLSEKKPKTQNENTRQFCMTVALSTGLLDILTYIVVPVSTAEFAKFFVRNNLCTSC